MLIKQRIFLLEYMLVNTCGKPFSVLLETALTSLLSQCGMLTTMVLPALAIGKIIFS